MNKLPRWIQDTNPDESIESRIEKLINSIVNQENKTDRQVIQLTLDELYSIWEKIQYDKTP